jgi:hypothetical protein
MNVLTFILLAAAAVKAALLGSGDGLIAAGTAVSKVRLLPLLDGLESWAAPAAPFLTKGFLGWRRWLVMAGRGTSSSRLARAATSGLPGRSASWEASNMSCD